jgi:hypothetical protein
MNATGGSQEEKAPSRLIGERIEGLGDWRGATLARLRGLIKQDDPDVVEEWKWVKPTSGGTPVWSHHGGICTDEVYKSVVKLTFSKGASLEDPSGLFNSSLEGKVRRAIDVHEGERIDEEALKALIRAAVCAERLVDPQPVSLAQPRLLPARCPPRPTPGRRLSEESGSSGRYGQPSRSRS